ncbi:hypothetical protein L2E82_06919 [Cichorium intybus]|uniref:Uncharacterized protein n=1 Tax=Cichorium intybus TaxID=13427 RepID=A0ACB9G5C8_CICIN|nr:hypothetical protein L2E82_06919 [Cichorium intybus]
MNPVYESWEEQAFAEDAGGPLGGSVWPPRFYSCSFCKREFRSAQALGGHMNIHRREKATLKQFLDYSSPKTASTSNITPPKNPNLLQNLFKSQNPCFNSSPMICLSRTFCSNSDTKKCVCDSPDHGAVEIDFVIGYNSDSCRNCSNMAEHRGFDDEEVMNCKRQKTSVMPLIIGSIKEVDLELKLAT